MTNNSLFLSVIVSVLLSVSGCGSSPGDDTPIISAPITTITSGKFFIGNISGLTYTSGSTTGVLSNNGQFRYELIDDAPQPVSFSVAGIELGSSIGKSVISPLDLVVNGHVDSTEVINKTTLLRLLSELPTARLTVTIDQRLIDNAANFSWPQPDFTATDFASSVEVMQILGDINTFLSLERTVPTAHETALFLKDRIYCAASGIYFGDIKGGDTGHVTFGISPIDGGMTTLGWSDTAQNIIFVQQPASPSFDSTIDFDSGVSFSGDNFIGSIRNFLEADGAWSNTISQSNGKFNAQHLNSDFSAIHHFSAAYVALFPVFGPGPAGTYSFSLYEDGTVTGSQVNITFADTTKTAISGTWEDNFLNATIVGGATISALLDFDNMVIMGAWSDPNAPITSGGIIGTGCQFNE